MTGRILFIREDTLVIDSIYDPMPEWHGISMPEPSTPEGCVSIVWPVDIDPLIPIEAIIVSRDSDNIILNVDNSKLSVLWAPMWVHLRRTRDELLSACDWTMTVDCALSDERKAEWRAYRQALRDLPGDTTNPGNPSWPSRPN